MKLTKTTNIGEIFTPYIYDGTESNFKSFCNMVESDKSDSLTALKEFILDIINYGYEKAVTIEDFFRDYFTTSFKKPISFNLYNYFGYFKETNFYEKDIETYYSYTDFDNLCNIILSDIFMRYYDKWKRSFSAIMQSYKVLAPFNIRSTKIDKDTLTSQTKDTGGNTSTDENTSSVYGYNTGETPKPSDKNIGSSTYKKDNQSDYTRTKDAQGTSERVGNIGNRSSTELIKQEFEFRRLNFIQDTLFVDLDSVFTRRYFGGEF